MVILKKIKASTLMETLVATILILVVFMIANTTLNNLFRSTIDGNTRAIDAHLNELQYQYINDKLTLPYTSDFKDWQITVSKVKSQPNTSIEFEAFHRVSKNNILKIRREN